MSSGVEHQACAEALGAYALGALPEEESARVRRHLASCRECRTAFGALRVAAEALPASVAQVEPPPELKARVMDIVRAEAELLQAAGATADRPVRSRSVWRWPSLTEGSWRPVAAVLAAAVVVAVVIGLVSGSGAPVRTVEAQMSVPGRAFITLRGPRAELAVRGIPAPPANHVDELWVRHGSGVPQPAGTFVLSSGTVAVQRPVRSGDEVLVTVEPGRGTRAPTSRAILTARA